jgi:hypothetical protein
MMYTTFNIGLNNNPFNYEQLALFIDNAFKRTNESVQIQLRNGEYQSNAEPTAVVRVTHSFEYQDAEWAELITRTLCMVCTQECIPYRHRQVNYPSISITDSLVYNDNFEGERYQFDEAYFIEYDEYADVQ